MSDGLNNDHSYATLQQSASLRETEYRLRRSELCEVVPVVCRLHLGTHTRVHKLLEEGEGGQGSAGRRWESDAWNSKRDELYEDSLVSRSRIAPAFQEYKLVDGHKGHDGACQYGTRYFSFRAHYKVRHENRPFTNGAVESSKKKCAFNSMFKHRVQ